MKMEVHCTVNNCYYWAAQNHCQASEILVTADSFANQAADRIDSPQASTLSVTPVNNCMETACKTFVPKNAPQATIGADAMTRPQ